MMKTYEKELEAIRKMKLLADELESECDEIIKDERAKQNYVIQTNMISELLNIYSDLIIALADRNAFLKDEKIFSQRIEELNKIKQECDSKMFI